MKFLPKIWWFLMILLVASCAKKMAPANTYNTVKSDNYRANGPSYDNAQPSQAPAPMAESSARKGSKNKAPSMKEQSKAEDSSNYDRPGLGTSFGETRNSNVREEAFTRASSSPFSAVSLFYNDAEGVAAQLRYQGGANPYPMYAYTPAGGISVSLQDERGNILSGAQAGGKTFVVGSDGTRYSLVIQNLTGGRFEVVASIDGLDVIDGRPADLNKRGYLLAPYGTLVIDGFRTSGNTVAAFRFGAVSDSYAGLTSGDRNVGVIGVGFFAERGSEWSTDELRKRDNANPFPGDPRYTQPPAIGY
jgi:hypothetical protein